MATVQRQIRYLTAEELPVFAATRRQGLSKRGRRALWELSGPGRCSIRSYPLGSGLQR